ncbi:nuclear transport factor 2 family protein [Peribacillus frigoritolerans]|uniref:nuclear transport factor 2 family protein n=1 Tax=Peribacillus frigoritolerans TaxID=450367 RepID=UPI001059E513|nr:nuclear transport factor 2 family protein [Peribacillus frigoritolerans]TDL80546.1 nuclear transport factor 2 family protein [Peribacillus frigoritolerans]
MKILNDYFYLFDQAGQDTKAMDELLSLFSPKVEIVLNGAKQIGFENFIKAFYSNNAEVKHMFEKWMLNDQSGYYETNWAVCGKTIQGKVYALSGIDRAKLNEEGKIVYLENIPSDKTIFNKYS